MKIDPERIAANGVVGAGGAGFPTYVKLQAQGVDTVILNAAECEPLLHKDKELLRRYPDEIVEAFEAIVRHLGAKAGVVGIKEKYREVIELVEGKTRPPLSVKTLRDFYPAGDEFNLTYEVTGRVIPPGGIPLAVNCLVTNVETVLNIALDRPVTQKYLTVAGAVNHPVTVRVPVGTSFSECLEMAEGTSASGPVAILEGGVMMGKLVEDLSKPVTKTTGGLIVLPADHHLIEWRKRPQKVIDQIGRSACDQCSFCTELCPRFLLGHPIEPHLAMRNLAYHEVGSRMVSGTDFCCECNLCTLYACPEDLDPRNACIVAKGERRTEGLRWSKEEIASRDWEPHPMETYRHIPLTKLMLKLGLTQFVNKGPLIDDVLRPPRLRIPLKQHIGVPAAASVQAGARVKECQQLGTIATGAMGVPVHASLAGTVESVSDEVVVRVDS